MVNFAITAFTSIFIIVDPLGSIPVFLGLTTDYDERRRRRSSLTAALTCFGVLSAFTLAGNGIMNFFNISLPALRIAGGIILFTIGMQMIYVRPLRVKLTPEEQEEWAARQDVGLIPMGFPMLAGPGAITIVVVLSQTGPRTWGLPIVIASVALVSLLIYVTLVQSKYLRRLLGQGGINVTMRLMGLILTAIAVQLVLAGLAGVAPGTFSRVVS